MALPIHRVKSGSYPDCNPGQQLQPGFNADPELGGFPFIDHHRYTKFSIAVLGSAFFFCSYPSTEISF